MQKEADKSFAKETQLQQIIDEMGSCTFKLIEQVRDADIKRRAALKHAKRFNQLAHRRLKRSKELLKRSNELGEPTQELNDEATSLIKDLTSQE